MLNKLGWGRDEMEEGNVIEAVKDRKWIEFGDRLHVELDAS